jgi:hypothetical protein
VADRGQDRARTRVERKLFEQLLDRPEARREVVAVVAVTEDRVETGQRRSMPIDRTPGPAQAGSDVIGADGRVRRG